jgi:hypothetical protein
MAIDLITTTRTVTRITEPLSASDPFTMTIDVPNLLPVGKDTLRVPGVIVQDCDPLFIEGYSWGRDCYFIDVDALLNADGTPHKGPFTLEDFASGAVHDEKVRDLTSSLLMRHIAEVMCHQEFVSTFSETERLGCIVGYIVACTEEAHGLLCPQCGRSTGLCTHSQLTITLPVARTTSAPPNTTPIPGIVVEQGDTEFIEGYQWGRHAYFSEVLNLTWPDGCKVLEALATGNLSSLHSVKDQDITAADLLLELSIAASEMADGNVSLALNAGYLFGYISACTETFYHVICPHCGHSQGHCSHQ